MKVVHSCTSESFSGLEAYVLELVSSQYSAGHDVELFCRGGSRLDEEARARGVPVWNISKRARPGLRLWREVYEGWTRRLNAGDCVLHMHAGGEPLYHLSVLAKPRGRLLKSILHFHIWINHKKRDPLHRALYALVSEVWTSSESARAHLAAMLPVKRDRIRVVPYGRDVESLEAAPRDRWRAETRRSLGIASDDRIGLCISRIEPIKGTRELVDAFLEVAPRVPNAHLVFIGGPSPANEEAARFAEELAKKRDRADKAVARRMHFVGFISPCEPFLAAADFYLLPSYEECMSLAMLDAAILGLPIIGTRSGGTPSVVRPDETGALVPPRDGPALAREMERFYRDPALCRELGEGAHRLARRFDRNEVFRQVWEWYGARPPVKTAKVQTKVRT